MGLVHYEKTPVEKVADDNSSYKSTDSYSSNSVHSAFKKFHLPHFHKRSNSTHKVPLPDNDIYAPKAPEPIMPSLVDWSPEDPLSPPPWELTDDSKMSSKRHSMGERNMTSDAASATYTDQIDATVLNQENGYHSDSECDKFNNNVPTTNVSPQHTRDVPVLKRYKHPSEKKSPLKTCEKARARAAEAAAQGESIGHHTLSFCEENLKYLYIPNIFDPLTREPVVEFATIKPRKYKLHRKTSWKREAKALMTWHHTLDEKLRSSPNLSTKMTKNMPSEKIERYYLTRRFILKEFFTTEVNFWNQLYYTKIVYFDALLYELQKGNSFVKEDDADLFANLFDLMQFSAKLINHLRHFQLGYVKETENTPCGSIECNNLRLGKILVEMAEDFVVFLRCALDYKGNRKSLDSHDDKIGYVQFRQKLLNRKETSQFTMKDYLIIPIQRVARYGLLLTDLIKHTDPSHVDYQNLIRAHQIITSLAVAMDSVQKKKKT
ncbi:MAG: Dbl homology domain-containing protein [Benjaminiella poitrasii]|nr:MAG: Dbl homology domain-containing protein [Benjaminiella poitrasii]